VRSNGHATDYDEADIVIVQDLEQRAKVELGQRALAAPLMALICLHSECTRASRSLIGDLRSALSRIARARASSLTSPLSALVAIRQV
jgi:hypothetical protein